MAKAKKQKKKCKSKDGLESLVIEYKPFRDENGERYIPLCDFGWHQGVVLKPEVCEKRNCIHYRKVYINKDITIKYEN